MFVLMNDENELQWSSCIYTALLATTSDVFKPMGMLGLYISDYIQDIITWIINMQL